jgi:Peptidase_C39 like family
MVDMPKSGSVIQSHTLSLPTLEQKNYTWSVSKTFPFDELLISWNAHRPIKGHYVILSRVWIQSKWSPWLLYAVWGTHEQFSFHDTTSAAPVHSFQDQVEVLDDQTASGFCIRVEACNGACLASFYDLYAGISLLKSPKQSYPKPLHSFPPLTVPNISQLCLSHPRASSFCSPTSTTAVIQYLASKQLHPVQFAKKVYDSGFDIYGNWSFNIAQAFVELGQKWRCFCARMSKIEWLWDSLRRRVPVVISVIGTLPKTLRPYSSGHLIVIKGYDAQTEEFLCMDPAFPSNDETSIAYPWDELMQAWERRHYLAYFFFPLCL